MGARLLLGQEEWVVTWVGDPSGQRIGQARRQEVTPWMYVVFGAMIAAIVVILIIVL